MKDKVDKLLSQAKGRQIVGGTQQVPELRSDFLRLVLESKEPETGIPKAMAVLKFSVAGAVASLTAALWMTMAELENRQEEAAMLWDAPKTEEGQ